MNKKYDNNNIIIASRAYFLHLIGFLYYRSYDVCLGDQVLGSIAVLSRGALE
jgi:hypothetical protein